MIPIARQNDESVRQSYRQYGIQRAQMEVSLKLGITQSVICRLWQRFLDDRNVSRRYNTDRPRVTMPNEDQCLAVTKKSRWSRASDLSAATGSTDFVFMDDNTRLHQENIVNEYLQIEFINLIELPAFSSGLNPALHVWHMLDQRVSVFKPRPIRVLELRRALFTV
ncbi:uncharacterized protein TNCV_1026091 [Trichonephila clavipes]|nr:uncharacterized protein TNCV_1026091 [Trichonephila clavipes]